ncbi:MAG: hypothetical protein SGJ27_11025 [Candidatus Melainabacteria bacterium]|nr:hypothetical protein [Candidatus Melainabacteria bacterium]
MVKIGLIIIIALSVLVGFLFLSWKSGLETRAVEKNRQAMNIPTAFVVHAAKDIKHGAIITASDVELKQITVSDREVAHNELLAPRQFDHYVGRAKKPGGQLKLLATEDGAHTQP